MSPQTEKCDFCYSDQPIKAYTHPEITLPPPIGILFLAGEWSACKECADLHEAGKLEELIERVMASPSVANRNIDRDRARRDLRYMYPQISREGRSILN
jgi:hypothetical protein